MSALSLSGHNYIQYPTVKKVLDAWVNEQPFGHLMLNQILQSP